MFRSYATGSTPVHPALHNHRHFAPLHSTKVCSCEAVQLAKSVNKQYAPLIGGWVKRNRSRKFTMSWSKKFKLVEPADHSICCSWIIYRRWCGAWCALSPKISQTPHRSTAGRAKHRLYDFHAAACAKGANNIICLPATESKEPLCLRATSALIKSGSQHLFHLDAR